MTSKPFPQKEQISQSKKSAVIFLSFFFFIKTIPVSAQPDIRVLGFPYPLQLKEYVQQCLSFLQVDRNIGITIIRSESLERPYEGKTVKIGSDTSGEAQFAIYLLAGLNSAKQSLVLAHELIHVKQYVSGRLEVRGHRIFWLGRRYYLNEESQFNPPWENEAHAQDQKLARNFIERPKKIRKPMLKSIAKNCN